MIKLDRFPYSCYALKVQYLLEALQLNYEVADVPYTDRTELVEVAGGRVMVPAIAHEGKVVVESRDICRYLMGLADHSLVPKGKEAIVWAYADWCDSVLEDVLFRLATPGIAAKFSTTFERALFSFINDSRPEAMKTVLDRQALHRLSVENSFITHEQQVRLLTRDRTRRGSLLRLSQPPTFAGK